MHHGHDRMLCGHLFCTSCIREWLREANSCPATCRVWWTGVTRKGMVPLCYPFTVFGPSCNMMQRNCVSIIKKDVQVHTYVSFTYYHKIEDTSMYIDFYRFSRREMKGEFRFVLLFHFDYDCQQTTLICRWHIADPYFAAIMIMM